METEFLICESEVRLSVFRRLKEVMWRSQYRTRKWVNRRLSLAARRMRKRMAPGTVCTVVVLK